MASKLVYQSPFSNFEIILLANNPKINEEFSNDQLFGLMTIANKPILQQILEQFFRLNFTKIIVVCLDKDESLYADFLFSYFKMDDLSAKVKLFAVDDSQTTCEIIRKITSSTLSHKFDDSSNPSNHIIVYPINLITSISLAAAVDFHIENSSMITIIAAREEQGITDKERQTAPGQFFRNAQTPAIKGKRLLVYNEANPKQLVELLSDSQSIKNDIDLILKSGNSSEPNFNGESNEQQESQKDTFLKNYEDDDNYDTSSTKSEEDIEFSINSSMKVSSFNLKRYRSLVVDPSIILTNAYILSPECIQFLFSQKSIHSIESELIPIICSQKVTKKTLKASIFLTNEKVFSFKITDYVSFYVANMRSAASNLVGFSPNADLIHIDTSNQDDDDENELNGIDEDDINKDIENYKNTLKAYYQEDPIILPEKFKYFSGNVYGANLIVQSNNTIIKKSIIGRHCKIGKRVKIINSILFDHVTVDDGVKLVNCIVGANSVIKKKSNLQQRIIMMKGSNSNHSLESDESLVQFGDK